MSLLEPCESSGPRAIEEVVREVSGKEPLPPLEAVVGQDFLDVEPPGLEKVPPLVHGGEALEDLVVIGPVARADHAPQVSGVVAVGKEHPDSPVEAADPLKLARRSEEHTSELQSPCNLVCRLLLEKKK